jgi:DNA primase
LIRKSPKLWEKAVREAVWFVDYYINHGQLSFPAGSVEQKHYLSESVIPLLQFIVDPIEQDHYVRELSSKFAISESVIRSQLKSKTSGSSVVAPLAIPSAGKANMAMEKQVLGGMLLVPEFMELVKEQGIGSEITDPNLRQMAQSLLDNSKSVMAVKQDTLAKEATFMVESELDNLNNNELALLRELKKSLLLLKLNEIKRTQQELTLEIKKAETINDSSKIEELNKKFAQLVTYRARIESELQ